MAVGAAEIIGPKKIVMCLDGTGGQIGSSQPTNVGKTYQMLGLTHPKQQIAYYDPGVGTMPESTARGNLGRSLSLLNQLAFGTGMRANLTQAYTWLMHHYQPGDKIYLFGFSRGAYTARALAGILTRPGLLRPGSENLVDYAVREYANNSDIGTDTKVGIRNFADAFCWGTEESPLFPQWPGTASYHEDWHCVPVEYAGLWDTVKASGFLHFGDLRWPYTRSLPNVKRVRHAVAIDERRSPFREYLVAPGPHVEEVWFTGMHSDVGWTRQPDQDLLSSVPLKWIIDAVSTDLIFREKAYQKYCSVTEDHALGRINKIGRLWSLAGTRRRSRPPGAILHSSVNIRRRHLLDYLPGDFPGQQWSDPNWTVPTR